MVESISNIIIENIFIIYGIWEKSDEKGEKPMDTLTKKNIVEDITSRLNLERKEASEALENFIEIIKDEL